MCLVKSVHLVVQHGIPGAHFLYEAVWWFIAPFPLSFHNLCLPYQLEISPRSSSLGVGFRQSVMRWERRKSVRNESGVPRESHDRECGVSASTRKGTSGPSDVNPARPGLERPGVDGCLCVLLRFLATTCHLTRVSYPSPWFLRNDLLFQILD